jgi:hypothetical protein
MAERLSFGVGPLIAAFVRWRGLDLPDPAVGQVWRSRHSGRAIRVADVRRSDCGTMWHVGLQHEDERGFIAIPLSYCMYPHQWRRMLRAEGRTLEPDHVPRPGPWPAPPTREAPPRVSDASLREIDPVPRRWIERWHGSGPDRGWWVWEADHGDSIAYCGEGEFAEHLCSLIVQKHNDALGVGVGAPAQQPIPLPDGTFLWDGRTPFSPSAVPAGVPEGQT